EGRQKSAWTRNELYGLTEGFITVLDKKSARRRHGTALGQRHEFTRFVPPPDLPRASNFLLGIVQHLLPLSQPSYRARDGKQHGKHLRLEPHRLIDDAR